jgi:hypothetical protein
LFEKLFVRLTLARRWWRGMRRRQENSLWLLVMLGVVAAATVADAAIGEGV